MLNQSQIQQMLQLAVELHNQGDLDQAEDIYRQVLYFDKDNFYALRFLGCLCRLKKKYSEGIELLSKAVSLNYEDIDCLYNLGNILAESGRHVDAIQILKQIINLKADFAEARQTLGWCLFEVGDYTKSEQELSQAVSLDASLPQAWLNLGNTLHAQKKYLEAIKSFRKAITVNPNFVDAYFALGLVLTEEGEFEDAITSYQKVIEIQPDFVEAHSLLGQLYDLKSDYPLSIKSFMNALSIDPNHLNSSAALGFAFLKLGDHKSAIKYYSKQILRKFCPISAYYLFRAIEQRISAKINQDYDIASDFCCSAMHCLGVTSILAFGDSHVNAFTGIKGIEVNYVGASTAYNLLSEDSSSGGSRSVWSRLHRFKEANSSAAVMLCFGEIDCRNHVIRQCYLKGFTIEASASKVVSKYVEFINSIIEFGFKVIIYGCYGSGSHFNAVGTEVERNLAAFEVNRQLKASCDQINVPFFSLNDCFVDEYGLTKRHLMSDDVHLPENANGGIAIKTLLMEHLMRSCKPLSSSSLIQFTPRLPEAQFCNCAIIDLGLETQSYGFWDDNGCLALTGNLVSSIFLDLGAELVIKGFILEFDTTSFFDATSMLSIVFKLNGKKVSAQHSKYTSGSLQLKINHSLARYVEISHSVRENLGCLTKLVFDIVKAI